MAKSVRKIAILRLKCPIVSIHYGTGNLGTLFVRLHSVLLYLMLAPAAWSQTYPFVMNTLAGSNPLGDGGPATSALLEFPSVVAVDGSGNLYINDTINNRIRKVTANGTISSFLSRAVVDFKVDAAGNLYAVDGNYTIVKISPSGAITLLGGAGTGGNTEGIAASKSTFNGLSGVAVDPSGNIFLADTYNHRVRKIATDGTVTTVAGNGLLGNGLGNLSGDGGTAVNARLAYPSSVAVDSAGNLYIGELYDIRKVNTAGLISTIAGRGTTLTDGAPASSAPIGYPVGLAVDASGSLYVADPYVERVRVITNNTIKTVAGTGYYGFSGDGGPATAAQLDQPTTVAVDAAGNVYIGDEFNLRVRKVDTKGVITTIAGKSHFAGDGGPATSALMHLPTHVVTDNSGNLYIADNDNSRIRKVSTSGTISTIAGTGTCDLNTSITQGASTPICYPNGLLVAADGSVIFADSGNSMVRRIASNGSISTIAGTGVYGDTGTGGAATSAQFKQPYGLAQDSAGNIYVSDADAHRVRKIATDGTVSNIAGNGNEGFAGDGSIATAAELDTPGHLALDSKGNLYISDRGNRRVRMVAPNGIISTVAGIDNCCTPVGKATQTYIGTPGGLTVDAAGNLYIALSWYDQIAMLNPAGNLTIVAGSGYSDLGDGGLAVNASLFYPTGLYRDAAGDIYVADTYNSRIRKMILNSPTKLSIAGGDAQTGIVGTTLSQPLTVGIAFRAGLNIPGIPVTFAVASGSATLSAANAVTDDNGIAGVGVTLGSTPGDVVVTATVAGLTPVQFHLTATPNVPTVPVPTISAGGVVGAASSVPAVTQISPGGFASIYGSNFAATGTSRAVQAADMTGGSLPTNLGGVCVLVGGLQGFLTYVSPGLVNFQVPAIQAGSNVNVQVVANCGTPDEIRSGPVSVATAAATPELLYWVANSTGKNPVVAVNAVSGAYVGAPGLISGVNFTPAKPGDYLIVYGISFGPTSPASTPGMPPTGAAKPTNTPVVTLGANVLPDVDVLYVGVSPGTAGLYQMNLQIPAGLADGDYPLVLKLGSYSTPTGGSITVRN